MDKIKQFYKDNLDYDLGVLLEKDPTVMVYIPTPKGWICKRCSSRIKHKHGIYPSLKTK